jgi:hypothetical protein
LRTCRRLVQSDAIDPDVEQADFAETVQATEECDTEHPFRRPHLLTYCTRRHREFGLRTSATSSIAAAASDGESL